MDKQNNHVDTGVAHPGHRRHRSAISNGNRLFPVEAMDQRTHTPMRFRDLVDDLIGDLGGKDRVSTGELQLIRRAATLSVICESMEADAVANRPFNIEMFGMLCDRLGRLFGRLGLERMSRDITAGDRSFTIKIGNVVRGGESEALEAGSVPPFDGQP
jgi:hypothetical protein